MQYDGKNQEKGIQRWCFIDILLGLHYNFFCIWNYFKYKLDLLHNSVQAICVWYTFSWTFLIVFIWYFFSITLIFMKIMWLLFVWWWAWRYIFLYEFFFRMVVSGKHLSGFFFWDFKRFLSVHHICFLAYIAVS